jgi:hypothetical protein
MTWLGFVDLVLVPDLAMVLIMEDNQLSEEEAVLHMERSWNYGKWHFPKDLESAAHKNALEELDQALQK